MLRQLVMASKKYRSNNGGSCMEKKDMNAVWAEYVGTRDTALKSSLIEHYVYLVKLVAGRLGIYLNQYVDSDDLVGYGVLGLIDAVDKFDPGKNVKFDTYASLRIRGAILDAIRKLDWVPRTLRKKQKDIDKAYIELEGRLGRQPLDEEVADFLEISIEEYNELLKEVNISSLISIDEYMYQFESVKDPSAPIPENYIEDTEVKEMLAEFIDSLPEREKKVIFLYYYEELTLKEISHVLEVSESRVSQLHTKAVSRLRAYMQKHHFVVPL